MRLAYLYSRYPVVSQTFCDSEMLALEAQGLRLCVGSLNAPPTSFRHERLSELQAEIFYPPPSAVLKTLRLPPAMSALAADHTRRYGASFKAETRARNAAYFARVFERQGVDHLHVHFANRATHTALFLKTAGFPFSFTAHAQDYMIDLGSHDLLREMAREAEFVIAVSDFSRADLGRLCPESAAKIHRVYNGLRLSDYSLAPMPHDTAPVLRLLSIGRLIEFKGFHHLIEAVRLLGERGVAVALQIIGEGPWSGRLERQMAKADLAGKVVFRGVLSQDQVRAELAHADVFALACCVDEKGASDILPTVILEAMAAGLPVVSTRLAGVPEMVQDGLTGLLCEPGVPAALADALARLAADPVWRRELGEAGRVRCQRLFSLDQTAGQVRALLDKAARRPGAKPAPSSTISVLCLSAAGAEPELPTFTEAPEVRTLAAAATAFEPWLEFLPDAMVLESEWRAHPVDAAHCERLYSVIRPADGETFFRDARRAMHTATLVRKRNLRHVHACRSNTVIWAWLVKKLTGIRSSFAIEDHPGVSRSLLAELIPTFDFGTIGDAKLGEMTGHRHPDQLGLATVPKKNLFHRAAGSPPDVAGWRERLLADP